MKKKKFILLITCLCIALGGCGNADDASKEEEKEEETYSVEYAQENPIQFGKNGKVGDWDISILSVKEAQKVQFPKTELPEETKKILLEKYNQDYDKEPNPTWIAEEKFIIIDMALKNTGDNEMLYNATDFLVKNKSSQKYSWNKDDLTFKLNTEEWLTKKNLDYARYGIDIIQPGETIKFLYACEVEKDAKLEDLLLGSCHKTSKNRYTYFKLK